MVQGVHGEMQLHQQLISRVAVTLHQLLGKQGTRLHPMLIRTTATTTIFLSGEGLLLPRRLLLPNTALPLPPLRLHLTLLVSLTMSLTSADSGEMMIMVHPVAAGETVKEEEEEE